MLSHVEEKNEECSPLPHLNNLSVAEKVNPHNSQQYSSAEESVDVLASQPDVNTSNRSPGAELRESAIHDSITEE
jgi:hypothetical protein